MMAVQLPRLVLDANILYSETLTDVFLSLAAAQLVAVVWSNRLREEWALALTRNRHDIDPNWIAARCQHLETAQNWACITIDDIVVEQLHLPDRNDRHVLGAAIQSSATLIVTNNLRDFPTRTLDIYNVRAAPADQIVRQLIDSSPARAIGALRPTPADVETHLEQLRRAGLARSVKALRAQLVT
jgi:predicted nucleic acid-binding protein